MLKIRLKRKAFEGDKVLWILMALLGLASLVVVLSSTASMAYRKMGGDMSYFFLSQLFHLAVGFTIVWFTHKFDYSLYKERAGSLFLTGLILLILTFFIGVTINGASRWLEIPIIGVTFQPSDFLKIVLVLFLAKQLSRKEKVIDKIPILPSFKPRQWREHKQKNTDILLKTSLPILLPVVLSCALIVISNFSTAFMVFLCSIFMMIVARVRLQEILRLLGLAVVGGGLLIGVMSLSGFGRAETWKNRIVSYAGIDSYIGDEDADASTKMSSDQLQKEQARIAIASGGLLGKGPGNSTQRTNLPHSYSDFAYAFVVEEYGFLGAFFVMLLYLCVLFRAILIAGKTSDTFSALVVFGLGLTVVIQAMVNMNVSSTLGPVTGQPLPIISLGGSSLLFTCFALGIMLSVSRKIEQENEDKPNDTSAIID